MLFFVYEVVAFLAIYFLKEIGLIARFDLTLFYTGIDCLIHNVPHNASLQMYMYIYFVIFYFLFYKVLIPIFPFSLNEVFIDFFPSFKL